MSGTEGISWPEAFVAVGTSFAAAATIIGSIKAWKSSSSQKEAAQKPTHSDIIEGLNQVRETMIRMSEQIKTLFTNVGKIEKSNEHLTKAILKWQATEKANQKG